LARAERLKRSCRDTIRTASEVPFAASTIDAEPPFVELRVEPLGLGDRGGEVLAERLERAWHAVALDGHEDDSPPCLTFFGRAQLGSSQK
jgi:hypothetical protein